MVTNFHAVDEHGNKAVIVYDPSNDFADGSGRITHWGLTTLGGRDVIRDEKGIYRIKGSTIKLISTDPAAP